MEVTLKLLTMTWDELDRDDLDALRREVIAQVERHDAQAAEVARLTRDMDTLVEALANTTEIERVARERDALAAQLAEAQQEIERLRRG